MIDPRPDSVLETARLAMAQAPEHSGDLSHRRPAPAPTRRELERAAAPSAQKARTYYETMSFSAAGIELGLSVVLGALFGHWVDGKIGTDPVLMILLTVVGFGAGVRAMLRAARKATKAQGASNS